MARPSLFTHRKFATLSARLGSQITAAGVLELVWHRAYGDGDPVLGPPDAVEFAIGWDGEPGACIAALLEAGFLEPTDDGMVAVHDLFEHAPDYVKKRRSRATARKTAAGSDRTTADSDRTTADDGGQRPPNGSTPTPAPVTSQLRGVGDAPRPTSTSRGSRPRGKPKPENQEAQRLLWLFRGVAHERRGITPGVAMRKDTARVAAKLVKARPAAENEAIVLAFTKATPKPNGAEVGLNVGALTGFAETTAATPAYREALKFVKTEEGRATVERLVELGRGLGEGVSS